MLVLYKTWKDLLEIDITQFEITEKNSNLFTLN